MEEHNNPSSNFFLKSPIIQSNTKLSPREVVLSLLRAKGKSQTDLANEVGVCKQALHNYLKGVWGVPSRTKLKIAEVLGVDSSVIWDLEVQR